VEVHRRKTRKRADLPEKSVQSEAAKEENKSKIGRKMLLHKYNLHLKQKKAIEIRTKLNAVLGNFELRSNFNFEDASISSTSMS